MNASPPTSPSDEPAAQIIDVVIPHMRKWRLLIVVIPIMVTVPVLATLTLRPKLTQLHYLAGGLLFGAGLVLYATLWGRVDRGRFRSKLDQRLENQRQHDGREVVEALASSCKGVFSQAARLPILLSELKRHGYTGWTLRSVRPERRVPTEPLVERFEPIPLDESIPAFAALETGCSSSGHTIRKTTHPTDDAADSSRLWRRRVTLAGGWLGVGVFALLAAGHAINSLVRWTVTRDFLIWSVALIVTLVGVGGRGAWRTSQQWFMVPGGLVRRRAKRWRQAWEVHLFRRSDGLLLIHEPDRRFTSLIVADDRADGFAYVTPAEAQLALRAWLSPLDPPDEEHLCDLA